ncbi:hypothetical protein K0C24_004784, partial [Salmonella enterica]|nr:hypothetical protein [Salmonella enterica]
LEMNILTEELKKRGISFFGKYSVNIDIDKIRIKDETIYGRSFKILDLPLKNKERSYKLVLNKETNIILGQKSIFKKKLLNAMLWRVFFIPYLLLCILYCVSFSYPITGIAIMLLLPVAFGFIIYSMCYTELNNYLDKMADTVSFFSGTITACIAIIKFSLSEDNQLFSLKSNFLNIPMLVFLIVFAFFASIKFFISMNQMLKARKVYLSQASNHQDRKNRPRVIRALNFLLTKKLCNFINTKIKLF